jgi:hypothetical protein
VEAGQVPGQVRDQAGKKDFQVNLTAVAAASGGVSGHQAADPRRACEDRAAAGEDQAEAATASEFPPERMRSSKW